MGDLWAFKKCPPRGLLCQCSGLNARCRFTKLQSPFSHSDHSHSRGSLRLLVLHFDWRRITSSTHTLLKLKEGTEMTREVQQKRFACVRNTSIAAFDLNPTTLECSMVFVECAFLCDDELDNAIETQHIHWTQLKPTVESNPTAFFVTFHFSQRHRGTKIAEFLTRRINQTSSGGKNIDVGRQQKIASECAKLKLFRCDCF